ncbi:proline iminopeptidase [Xylocopilactobacillus apis]|uniref:Proline iminopeptidase n=1 Tax=Xylocopilactobacillus apis TaxID=2932183 RepID=A0AAU9DQX1_9LACO|nr:proline iminopeptidase-family hydrolase [Xylocopilactobacillus apis]BDR56013.1 proline iminopeptidase [Xylocopilactobacillus apis]
MKISEGYMPFLKYQTYYRIVGENNSLKAPLLLIHGGPGSSHNYFEVLDDYSKTGRQLIMYDQIGCGKSSIPEDETIYVKETWINELIALRDYLQLDQVHIVGQSWGGMLSLSYLSEFHATGIKSLMTNGAAASIKLWNQEQQRLMKYLSYEDQIAIKEAEKSQDFDNVKYLAACDRFLRKFCGDGVSKDLPESLQRPTNGERVGLVTGGEDMFNEDGTISDFEITDQLSKIKTPVLITSGTDDFCTPLISKSIYDQIPNAKWHLFNNSRHLAFLDQPDEFINVLDQWLKDND